MGKYCAIVRRHVRILLRWLPAAGRRVFPLDAKDLGHDPFELDLDVLRERHLFSENQP